MPAASSRLLAKLPSTGFWNAATLSLGYDMTQPLVAGIVTDLDRKGQAMGLNVFFRFIDFGIGSLLFGEALRLSFVPALAIFSAVQLEAALAAIRFFRFEIFKQGAPVTGR